MQEQHIPRLSITGTPCQGPDEVNMLACLRAHVPNVPLALDTTQRNACIL